MWRGRSGPCFRPAGNAGNGDVHHARVRRFEQGAANGTAADNTYGSTFGRGHDIASLEVSKELLQGPPQDRDKDCPYHRD